MKVQNIVELEDSTWEKNVEKLDKPVFVMFYSPTCSHCKAMDPYFEEYAKEFKEQVLFAKINVMNNPIVASRYGIMGTPTFKFFCEGHPIQELAGAMYPTLLKKAVEEGLQHGAKCVKNTTWFAPDISGYA